MRKGTLTATTIALVFAGTLFTAPANAATGPGEMAHSLRVVPAAWCTTKTSFWIVGDADDVGHMPTLGTSKTCELASGLKNNGVYWLQFALNKCYSKSLVLDGDFGPATRTALQQVQTSHGLVADGVYGTQTRAAMRFATSYPFACVRAHQISGSVAY